MRESILQMQSQGGLLVGQGRVTCEDRSHTGNPNGSVVRRRCTLSTFATDAAGELDVLGHDGNAASVDGAQVGVFEKAHKVGLGSLLQSKDGRALEAQV